MNVNLPIHGRYIVAVSGGIDSVCLLHMLVQRRSYDLVVAHFDHGIRRDSYLDQELVAGLAKTYKLKFYSKQENLGNGASESIARRARYDFLYEVQKITRAEAIITAHHQDDRLETLVMNLIRGTGRKGIGSIVETDVIKRPLLNVCKQELKSYAIQHKLSWREDSTNNDPRYLRNYVRHNVLPRLDHKARGRLIELMDRQSELNLEIDLGIRSLYSSNSGKAKLSRSLLSYLTYNESKELIATWLRDNNLVNFDHKTIERITLAAKTKKSGTKLDVYNRSQVVIDKEFLALCMTER